MAHVFTILITGGTRGIGRATVERLAQRFQASGSQSRFHLRLLVVGTNRVALSELERLYAGAKDVEASVTLYGCEADLTKPVEASRIVYQFVERHCGSNGALDAVILNAGLLTPLKAIANMTEDDMNQLVAQTMVNLTANSMLISRLIPALKRSSTPRIVLVSSGAAVSPMRAWSGYCSTKAAINMLARSMAVEEPEIITTAVSPGPVQSDMQVHIREHGVDMAPADRQRFISLYEEGRLTPLEDAADFFAAAALVSPKQFNGDFIRIYEDRAQSLIKQYREQFAN